MAASLASQIREKGKGPVAITTFANGDYGPAFNVFLVDRLNVFLSIGNNGFDVVARDRVEEAFKEINLALAKNFDSLTFARIGKQLGARSLIRGSYTVQSAAAVVSIVTQIVDVETGRIVGGDIATIPYTGDIKEMLPPRAVGAPVAGSLPSVSNASDTKSVSPEALRGGGTAAASVTPQSPNERIRATVDQFALSPDKGRASLAMMIENLAREPVILALENENGPVNTAGPNAKVSLSDDRATTWHVESVVGLRVVPCCYRRLSEIRQEDFTVLGPADRLRVVIVFSDDNKGVGYNYVFGTGAADRNPGSAARPTTFSFTADALYYLASGPQRFSIQLPSIKAPR